MKEGSQSAKRNLYHMTFLTHKNSQLMSRDKRQQLQTESMSLLSTDMKQYERRQEIFRRWLIFKQEMMKYFDKTLPAFFDRWDLSYSISLAWCVIRLPLKPSVRAHACLCASVCVKHLLSE